MLTKMQGQRNDFMRKLEEMEEGMRLEVLKQKGGVVDEKKSQKKRKTDLVVEDIDLKLLQLDIDRLYMQIYTYIVVRIKDFRARCTLQHFTKFSATAHDG